MAPGSPKPSPYHPASEYTPGTSSYDPALLWNAGKGSSKCLHTPHYLPSIHKINRSAPDGSPCSSVHSGLLAWSLKVCLSPYSRFFCKLIQNPLPQTNQSRKSPGGGSSLSRLARPAGPP